MNTYHLAKRETQQKKNTILFHSPCFNTNCLVGGNVKRVARSKCYKRIKGGRQCWLLLLQISSGTPCAVCEERLIITIESGIYRKIN